MPIAVITGSGGLVGSESVRIFAEQGFDLIGVENDMRAQFFGPEASTAPTTTRLESEVESFKHLELDIRDSDGVFRLLARHARDLDLIVHTAAQPSHDWAADDPHTDFGVNAQGTLNLLEAARRHTPELCERIAGRELRFKLSERPRIGDHRWWIRDLDAFKRDYPSWSLTYDIEAVLQAIQHHNVEQWTIATAR